MTRARDEANAAHRYASALALTGNLPSASFFTFEQNRDIALERLRVAQARCREHEGRIDALRAAHLDAIREARSARIRAEKAAEQAEKAARADEPRRPGARRGRPPVRAVCGTRHGYNNGCRCEPCSAAASAYMRAYRLAKAQED